MDAQTSNGSVRTIWFDVYKKEEIRNLCIGYFIDIFWFGLFMF